MNNKTDILIELKALSPFLLQLKEKEVAVNIPDHYFEKLGDEVMNEIHTTSGVLSALTKEKTAVPAAYFETFTDNILSKIKEEEAAKRQKDSTGLPTRKSKVYVLFSRVAFAAVIVGAILLVKEVQQPTLPVNDCADGIACLTQEEIYQYMNTNSHEFDVQQIQETVKPLLDTTATDIDIEKQDAEKYIEENRLILELDDSSTDIF